MKADRGSRRTAPPNLNLGASWRWMINATHWPINTQERTPVPSETEARRAPWLAWTCCEIRNSPSDRDMNFQPVAQTPYQLSHFSPYFRGKQFIYNVHVRGCSHIYELLGNRQLCNFCQSHRKHPGRSQAWYTDVVLPAKLTRLFTSVLSTMAAINSEVRNIVYGAELIPWRAGRRISWDAVFREIINLQCTTLSAEEPVKCNREVHEA
jgi:hypothetical protein